MMENFLFIVFYFIVPLAILIAHSIAVKEKWEKQKILFRTTGLLFSILLFLSLIFTLILVIMSFSGKIDAFALIGPELTTIFSGGLVIVFWIIYWIFIKTQL